MSFKGFSTEDLEALRTELSETGSQFVTSTAELAKGVRATLEKFDTELNSLSETVVAYNDDSEAAMGVLAGAAASVAWTGRNRDAFNTDTETLSTTVKSTVSAVTGDIEKLRAEVNNKFKPPLNDFEQTVQRFGGDVEQTTADFDTVVNRTLVDGTAAANVGWTSA